MIWKTILVAFLAIGVLCAEYKVTKEQLQQYKNIIKEACKMNGAEDKAEAIEETVRTFGDCVKNTLDVNKIEAELEEARKKVLRKHAVSEVLKKYCVKSTEIKTCFHTLTAGVSPCLDPALREYIGAADSTTDQVIDFVCYNDGERVAEFIVDFGPECVLKNIGSLRECVVKFGENIKSVGDAKKLTLAEQCVKYDELTACIVETLRECKTTSPGNMAESLFSTVRKSSPCNKE